MADIRVNALPDLPSGIAAEDILHILDASTTANVDSKTTVDDVAEWIIDNKNITVSGIDAVPGLRDALDGKSNVGHTHTIQQIVGLTNELNSKLNSNQANISGRIINIKGVAITVPSEITGVRDDRIPDNVIIGEYLQFDAADGGINNISGDTLKSNLSIDLVDNTADANKPISTATQTALDTKNSISNFNTGQAAQDVLISANTARATEIALNTLKNSYPTADANKLAGIEAGADVTDVGNVWDALGISGTGSTSQVLTQRGVYVNNAFEVTKSDVDAAIGSGSEGTDYYSSDKTWLPIPTGGGTGSVTKAAVDAAIGASITGDSGKFYDEQGRFIDVVYDSIEAAPIIRNATIETITITGTRTNVQTQNEGTNEFSTITLLDTFNPVPTQYTTTFTSPNTTFTPALVLPAGSQGTSMSLTELDGTVHRFCYLVNGNYRLLAGGLTGTLRAGSTQVATTATVTAAVTVPDQTAGQTITLVGDETGTFSVGDFISPQANNFGAYRGIFADSITFDGTNTVIVGPSNGATTFQTTSILRRSSAASTIQGTLPTWSYTPDTGGTVYSSAITNRQFTGSNLTEYIAEIVAAVTGLETDIVQFGGTTATTLGGEAASSFTFDLGTETNIDSSFTIAGGLNNMNTLVNTDGEPGVGLTTATTITVLDPEATEVASQTFGVADDDDNNVDDVGNFINDAVNNNTEAPIDFTSEYGSGVLTLTAQEAGNTNPWTIIINNNGATAANAGNLSTSSFQTGELINQIETLSVVGNMEVGERISHIGDSDTYIRFQQSNNIINLVADGDEILTVSNTSVFVNTPSAIIRGTTSLTLQSTDSTNIILQGESTRTRFNPGRMDRDFLIIGTSATTTPLTYDAGNHTLTTDATLVGFGGGGTSTTVLGTTGEIDVATVGDTATVSLSSTITDEITANTGKTGITTAQATAITNNTAKTGITTAQSSAITTNTSKVGITTAQATAITNNTAKTGITTAQSNAITTNTAKNSYPTADATKLGTIETNADVTDTDNVVGSLTAGNNITISAAGVIAATAGGTSTTVLGTTGEIDVNTVGSNATVSLSSTITDAIDLNTAKQSVAGLTQVGGAIVASDSLLYYDNTTPRRKVFSSVPLSVFNNDANFITGITKANVDTAIGTGGATTDYYASDKTWKTIPSAGVGDAVLANTQTFTGQNTFSDTAIFSDNASSIQVASIIAHQGDLDTYINFLNNTIILVAGNVNGFNLNTTRALLNPVGVDLDFTVNGIGKDAFSYNAGTDTFDVNATNITGVADAETGTWTPDFANNGTIGTINATYSRAGKNVILQGAVQVAAGTSGNLLLRSSSLPFGRDVTFTTGSFSLGTWYTALSNGGGNNSRDVGILVADQTFIYLISSSTNAPLASTDVRGFIGFTLTYETTD